MFPICTIFLFCKVLSHIVAVIEIKEGKKEREREKRFLTTYFENNFGNYWVKTRKKRTQANAHV